MSPSLDTALTILGFVVILPGVAYVIGMAPFALMTGDSLSEDCPALQAYLVVAAVVVPPLVVLGEYVIAIVWAWRAGSLTFYYPWIALAVGAASWFAVAGSMGIWTDSVGRRRNARQRDVTKPYAIAGTIHEMSAAEIAAELDGQVLDNRIGRPGPIWLTPSSTSTKKRALPSNMFNREFHAYVVRADRGLPPGWGIERSEVAPWLGLPGGGTQYIITPPPGEAGTLQQLIDRGFLAER